MVESRKTRREKKKQFPWIQTLAIILLIVVGLFVRQIVIGNRLAEPQVLTKEETQQEEVIEEEVIEEAKDIEIETVGHDGQAIIAHVKAPGGWTLHWKRAPQDLLDSVTGEEAVADDMALYISKSEAIGVYPLLKWEDQEVRGEPIK